MAVTGWSTSNFLRHAAAVVTAPPFTMAAWASDAATGGIGTIGGLSLSSNNSNTQNRYSLRWSTGAAPQYQAADGADNALISPTGTISAGVPFHLCAVESAANSRAVYFNGGGKTTDTVDVSFTPDRTSLGIHDRNTAQQALASGDIVYDFAIWNVALSDAEVALLAKGISPFLIRPDKLVGYWPLIRNPYNDWTGGFNFTIQGSLSVATHKTGIMLPITARIGGITKAGSAAKILAADAGSHLITGTAATPEHDKQVVADAGSHVITGSDATLTRDLPLAAGAGSYAVSGADAALEHDKQVVADAGSYAITGEAAALNKGLTLSVDAGSHLVTGSDATFEHDRQIIADAGSHVITGSAAALEHDKQIRAPDGRWVASNVNASVVLSLGDLKATFGGASPEYRSGAAAFSLSSGKHYWEITADVPAAQNTRAVGLAAYSDLAALVTDGNWLGINVPEVAVYGNSETWVNGNFTAGIGKSFGAGSVVRIAFDATAGKLWAGDSIGWWIGDPATGTSPLISGIANDIWFPAFTLRGTGDSYTANFGATAFAHGVPSGFTAADAAVAGGYVIAGTTAALEHDRQVVADAGSHIITGADATLTVGQTLVLEAEAGSHVVTGSDATLTHSIILEADAGSYAVAGSDVTLEVSQAQGAAPDTHDPGWRYPGIHEDRPRRDRRSEREELRRQLRIAAGLEKAEPEPAVAAAVEAIEAEIAADSLDYGSIAERIAALAEMAMLAKRQRAALLRLAAEMRVRDDEEALIAIMSVAL